MHQCSGGYLGAHGALAHLHQTGIELRYKRLEFPAARERGVERMLQVRGHLPGGLQVGAPRHGCDGMANRAAIVECDTKEFDHRCSNP